MKYSITGVDIGTEEIKVCVMETDTKENIENIIGFFKYPIAGLRKGYISNDIAFKQSLKRVCTDLEKNLGTKIDTIAISIGSASIESVICSQHAIVAKADNEITNFDIESLDRNIEESLAQKMRKNIWNTITEYKVDGKVSLESPVGQKGTKVEIKKLSVSVLGRHFEEIENAFFENDIEIAIAYPKGITASQIGLSEKQKIVGVGYLDIGAETTSLVVYENNMLIGYTVIPYGSNDITNDIALGLKISLEEAQEVKHGVSTKIYPKKKLDDIIQSRLEDISEVATSYLKKIKKHELLPGGIVLNGGGMEIAGIEEYFRNSLNLPVKKIIFEISTQRKGVVRNTEFLECFTVALQYKNFDMKQNSSKNSNIVEKIKKTSSSFFRQFLP